MKTLLGTAKWRVQPFTGCKNHYVAFVCYAQKAMNDPSAAPDVLIFPSPVLKAFVDRQTSPTINVQNLGSKLGIGDSWRELIAAAA
ncbi:MAG: hypothetical protein WB973_07505 [Thermoanaerobaculia bacterium]